MAELMLLFDIKKCIGCRACEVACKQEKDLPVGPRLIYVSIVGPRQVGDKLRMDFIPITCLHCGKAPCIEACPEKAILKREDGVVIINDGLCNGCKLCLQVCPFGGIQYHPIERIAIKCDLCIERVDKGLKPACVQHCPAQAIVLDDANSVTKLLREKRAFRLYENRNLAQQC